jgi:predicted MFS family arabinose efflux permease
VCVLAIGLALLGFALAGSHLIAFALAATVFFSAFNLLEAALPSLVSRLAPTHLRGAAMGAYSTSQFLGAFVGGALGGLALRYGVDTVFVGAAAMTLLWLPLVVFGARRIAGDAATVAPTLA